MTAEPVPASPVGSPVSGERCNCATFGNAALCPHHTQADYDAAERFRLTAEDVSGRHKRDQAGFGEVCATCRMEWPCDAELIRAERDAAVQEVTDLRAHMTARHRPREREVYSAHHDEQQHHVEDERCSEACFETMTLCGNCGSAFPCLELQAFRAVLDGAE